MTLEEQKKRVRSGLMYNDLTPELVEERRRAVELTNEYNASYGQPPEIREKLLKKLLGEEEKSELEPLRVWGKVDKEKGEIVPAKAPLITAQCLRVAVQDGHTAAVFVNFEKKPTKEEILERWKDYAGEPQKLELPSAPKQFIQYFEEDNRPQPRLDRDYEHGMGVSLGRLREDTLFDYKFVGLSHNTVRGAAGGAILLAELLAAKGYIEAK